jgi:hypothetical protein
MAEGKALIISRIKLVPIHGEGLVIELFDDSGQAHPFYFDSNTAHTLIDLSSEYREHILGHPNDTEYPSHSGELPQVLATNISIDQGRSPAECEVNITLKNVPISFLIPLDNVIRAFIKLREKITQASTH